MATRTNTVEKNSNTKLPHLQPVWHRAISAKSEWPDKVFSQINKIFLIKVDILLKLCSVNQILQY